MTTDYRAELQLLFDAAESFTEPALGHHRPWATALERARALLAQPEPEGADLHYAWADLHYAWEVHDAAGDWQAGGSANSLEDVQREGNRYLQTYSQDGPHKLIIQRHCVSTIEEVTND
jgi:hypothetical protein